MESVDRYIFGSGAVPESIAKTYVENLDSEIFIPQTSLQVIIISCAYLAGVLLLNSSGIRYSNLKNIMCVYNLIMSAWSAYMFISFLVTVIGNWSEAGWDLSLLYFDPELKLGKGIQNTNSMFLYSKYIEYLDTVWMILLGKLALTPRCFLQVYHHAVTPLIVWSSIYTPFTCNWIGPLTNTFVHVFMYFYYGVSHFVKSKSFRKLGNYIFLIQMTQFFMCAFSGFVVLFMDSMGPRMYFLHTIAQYLVFIVLFIVFYRFRQAELKQKSKKQN